MNDEVAFTQGDLGIFLQNLGAGRGKRASSCQSVRTKMHSVLYISAMHLKYSLDFEKNP